MGRISQLPNTNTQIFVGVGAPPPEALATELTLWQAGPVAISVPLADVFPLWLVFIINAALLGLLPIWLWFKLESCTTSFVAWINSHWCCKRRRATRRWRDLLGQVEFWENEQQYRHDRTVWLQWRKWQQLGWDLRRNLVPLTWQDWNRLSGTIRRHLWHRTRQRRHFLRD